MEEVLISFETAKLAKEKGLDITVVHGYKSDELDHEQFGLPKGIQMGVCTNYLETSFIAPSQSLLQKWLREIHNIQVIVTFNQIDYKSSAKSKNYSVSFYNIDNDIRRNNQLFNFKTYEQALEKGLQEALKLLPNKN